MEPYGTSTLSGASVKGSEFYKADRDLFKVHINVENLIVGSGGESAQGNAEEEIIRLATSGHVPNGGWVHALILNTLQTIFGSIRRLPTFIPASQTTPAPIAALSPMSSTAERYLRCMLEVMEGYPLYEPGPGGGVLLRNYQRKGARVGDVGLVKQDGGFDFLFNICPFPGESINPPDLPDDFEMLQSPDIEDKRHFQCGTHLFSNGVTQTQELPTTYKCLSPEGAVLELPAGATRSEAQNKLMFRDIAVRQADKWYRYVTLTRGRDAANGSLYLVTTCIKCREWGIAVFERASEPQDFLRFTRVNNAGNGQGILDTHRWESLGAVRKKVEPDPEDTVQVPVEHDELNQCVFLRGYKIMLQKSVWDNLFNPRIPQASHAGSVRQSSLGAANGQTFQSSAGSQSESSSWNVGAVSGYQHVLAISIPYSLSQSTTASAYASGPVLERVIIAEDFNAIRPHQEHPSDLINTALLKQETDAQVALTHDDEWCRLLKDSLGIGSQGLFKNAASLYSSGIDQNASISLIRANSLASGKDMINIAAASFNAGNFGLIYVCFTTTPLIREDLELLRQHRGRSFYYAPIDLASTFMRMTSFLHLPPRSFGANRLRTPIAPPSRSMLSSLSFDSIFLHPFLVHGEESLIKLDFRDSISHVLTTQRAWLNEPATNPPIRTMNIICTEIPYSAIALPQDHRFVTVFDLLVTAFAGIHGVMSTNDPRPLSPLFYVWDGLSKQAEKCAWLVHIETRAPTEAARCSQLRSHVPPRGRQQDSADVHIHSQPELVINAGSSPSAYQPSVLFIPPISTPATSIPTSLSSVGMLSAPNSPAHPQPTTTAANNSSTPVVSGLTRLFRSIRHLNVPLPSRTSQESSSTTGRSKGNAPPPGQSTRPKTSPSWMDNVSRASKPILRTFGTLKGTPAQSTRPSTPPSWMDDVSSKITSTLGVAGPSSQSGSSTLPVNPPSEDLAAKSHQARIGSLTTSKSIGNAPPSDESIYPSIPPSWMDVVRVNKTILKTLKGASVLGSFVELLEAMQVTQPVVTKEYLEEYFRHLLKSVNKKMKGLNTSPKLKYNLERFDSTLSQILKELHNGENNAGFMEEICHKMAQTMHSFMLFNCISGIIRIESTLISVEKHILHQCVRNLPHANAAHNDYQFQKQSGACFVGTREALLEDIATWISDPEMLYIYLLSGRAGTGKSTIAFTIAERAECIGYLGASFFFSRGEVGRRDAKRFFSTIAFQLCHYDEEFARAIESVLLTERGLAAVEKDPITQLEVLILEPLQLIVRSRSSPIVTVVDALDECDDRDAPIVLAALNHLVHELPCFKVILTARPKPHLPPIPKVSHLDIEEKTDGDIRLYLQRNLSRNNVSKIFPKLRKPWGASSQDIDALVRSAGRLFTTASTILRFLLNPRFGDPELRMMDLRDKIDNNQLSFKDLDSFYTIILRIAVSEDSDKYTKQCYQDIVGAIILIQDPLPIEALEKLTGSWSADSINDLLGDLQSVILVKDDTPRIYDNTFSDFITNCKDDDLRIIPRKRHTRLASRCFEIMNTYLRQNILELGIPARFMDNDAGLSEEKISAEQLTKKIPRELQYACTYWANHLESADSEDPNLLQEVDAFIKQHLLHWLEVLSLIGKLDIATDALRVILKSMKLLYGDSHGIISDALHFIPKFYDRARQAALHIYYSCLPFTPTESVLLKSHSKEMADCICRPEGVRPQWDPLIAKFGAANSLMFSNDSSKFAAGHEGEMNILEAENGVLLRTFKGDRMSIAYDFSAVAVLQASTVTLWSVASEVPITTITLSEKVVKLALSFDGSRLAAGLSNGTVNLWDSWKGELITSLVCYAPMGGQLEFTSSGYRLAFVSGDGTMQLWDGHDGKLVGTLDYMSKKHIKFAFSRDSCRLASLVKEDKGYSLTLWGSEGGNLIGVAESIGKVLEISEDGSFIATGGHGLVQLWSGIPLSLLTTLDAGGWIQCLAISRGVLAIVLWETLRVYDINDRAFVVSLQQAYPVSLAFSPDFTRLAVGNLAGVSLYDAPSLKTFTPASIQHDSGRVSTLAFSSDSTRLASGFNGGTVQLWVTSCMNQPIATHKLHSDEVSTMAFSLDGNWFASGSNDQAVRLWDGRDGAPLQLLDHSFIHVVRAVAFSRSLLAASTKYNITIFDHQSLHVVAALEKGSHSLSFSSDGSFLASAFNDGSTSKATVWNVDGWVIIADFCVGSEIIRLTSSPNGLQLAAQGGWRDGTLKFFNVTNKQAIKLTEGEDLHWVPGFVNGVLISRRWDRDNGGCLIGRFPGHPGWVPILWIPNEFDIVRFAVSSSMVALGCTDGRILFVRI